MHAPRQATLPSGKFVFQASFTCKWTFFDWLGDDPHPPPLEIRARRQRNHFGDFESPTFKTNTNENSWYIEEYQRIWEMTKEDKDIGMARCELIAALLCLETYDY